MRVASASSTGFPRLSGEHGTSEKGESWRQAKSASGLGWKRMNSSNPQKDDCQRLETRLTSATPPNEELGQRLLIKLPHTRLFYFSGLRKRILTLFLQYCKTPLFNPEAARIIKVSNITH